MAKSVDMNDRPGYGMGFQIIIGANNNKRAGEKLKLAVTSGRIANLFREDK